ncbi:MAG: hypothetical protein RL150_164 [Candidatus Parcubacteria bacterium]|jgi:alpha-beta hydrolase superfamily lysophospholipase
MKKHTLTNRHGLKIVGVLECDRAEPAGTCVIMHGWGGHRNKPTVQAIKKAFLAAGFQTFNVDATHSFGESGGDFEQSTLQTFWEDFEDATTWAKTQDWFVGPLAVAGHSKGAYAAARYAEEHPDDVTFAVPVAPVVSGELSFAAYKTYNPEKLAAWERDGVLVRTGSEGDVKKQHWSQMLERLNHTPPDAAHLTMPVLLLVGSQDTSCPPEHIQVLFDALPAGNKTMHVFEGFPHSFHEAHEQEACTTRIQKWLEEVLPSNSSC